MELAVVLCITAAILISVVVNRRRSTIESTRTTSLESVEPLLPNEDYVEGPAVESVAQGDTRIGSPLGGWKWKTIGFMDVETTGLTAHDRVVTLAFITFDVPTLDPGETKVELTFSAIHRIYNPGRNCDPVASRIHGHSDWKLRHQPFFSEEAEEVAGYLGKADLIVCHNSEFDFRFVNRELANASLPPIAVQSFCTMEGYRKKYTGSASLNNVILQLGLSRESGRHGALEDAWLTMNVFFHLQGMKAAFPFSTFSEENKKLQNLRDVPPLPDDGMPPRRRAPQRPRPTSV
jgi:DNA polymerase III subunit epsilon